MAYVIKIYENDNHDSPIDIITDVSDVEFTRIIRGTESINFSVSRTNVKLHKIVLGKQVRILDTDSNVDIARGIVSGNFDLGDKESITVTCRGFYTRLADHYYPPDHIMTGSLQSSAAKYVQTYDWRKVTSLEPKGSTFDGKSMVSFNGNLSSGVPGMSNRLDQGAGLAILWNMHTDDDEDSSGLVSPRGTDKNSNGIFNNFPFVSNAIYESPYLDFQPPSGVESNTPIYDRLRVGGYWNDDTEVTYQFEQYNTSADARVAAGSFALINDPEGVGVDLSSILPNKRMAEVKLKLTPIATDDGSTISVSWFMVVARTPIPQIQAGTWPDKTLSDNFSVGGRSLISVLDELAENHRLEYRMDIDGNIDMQSVPFDGQWVLRLNGSSILFEPDGYATNGTDTVTFAKLGLDNDSHVIINDWSPELSTSLLDSTITGNVSSQSRDVDSIGVGSVWGNDLRQEYTLVDGIHCTIDNFTEDSSSLTNWISLKGSGAGTNASEVIVQDDTSQDTYGLRQSIFNSTEQTMAELKVRADDLLSELKDPRVSMKITVVDTPSGNFNFEPGDRIRVISRRLKDHSDNDIEMDLRIMGETRKFNGKNVDIKLDLENNPARVGTFTKEISSRLKKIRRRSEDSVNSMHMASVETATLTSTGADVIQTYNIPLQFTPTKVVAWVDEVQDDDTGIWYSARGGTSTVQVVNEIPTQSGAQIEIKRTSGTGGYTARIRYMMWGPGRELETRNS